MKRGQEQSTVESPKPPADDRSETEMIGLAALKKLKGRSLRELSVRGAQKLASYSSQISPPKIPSDNAFARLVDRTWLNGASADAESLSALFAENSSRNFFPAFKELEESASAFRKRFEASTVKIIAKADKIVDGRLDVLGYTEVDFGTPIDWRFDPISGTRSDLRHWSLFDELDSKETGDKKRIWEANRHQHLFTLGLAYVLTGEEIYAKTAASHFESWMEQNPPELGVNWVSSLEISLRAISWIWALNLLSYARSITPELRLKVFKHLYLHGRHIENQLSLYKSPNTHLTGEALGLYYLGTQLGFLKCAKRWRAKGEEILIQELDRQILPDGVYFEQSFWYQRYTIDFYLHFHLLRQAAWGGREDASTRRVAAGIQSMTEFMLHVMRPDGTTPMVGDDDGGRCLPHGFSRSDDFRGMLSTAATIFKRGDFKHGAGQFLEESFWLLGIEGVRGYEQVTTVAPAKSSVAFDDGGYYVMRDGVTETDNFMLIDCGPLGAFSGAHGHADALSFELAVAGRTILVDSGTYTYHESDRLRDFFRSTDGHNTLIVDGESQSVPGHKFSWETKASASPAFWISEERFDFFEGSHDGYQRLDQPVTHTRGVLFVKNDYWIVRDFAAAVGHHEYSLNFHFNMGLKPNIRRLEDGNWSVDQLSPDGQGLRIVTFGDAGEWHQKESWISRNHGERVNAPLFRYSSAGTGSQEFFTFMVPAESGSPLPSVTEDFIAGGRLFHISARGYEDFVAYCDTDFGVSFGNVETDFRFCWIRIGVSGGPEEFILIDGSRLSIAGVEVVDSPKGIAFASIRVLGNRFNVRTSVNVYSVIID